MLKENGNKACEGRNSTLADARNPRGVDRTPRGAEKRPPAVVPSPGSKGFKVSIEGGERVLTDRATGERHARVLNKSPLERLYPKTISRDQLEAGLRFAEAFELAGLLAKPAMVQDLVGVASGRRMREPVCGHIDADREVTAVMRHVGALGGLVLEWVVGQGYDVTEFVRRVNWSGRALNRHQAMGLLLGALSTLAAFYQGRRPVSETRL